MAMTLGQGGSLPQYNITFPDGTTTYDSQTGQNGFGLIGNISEYAGIPRGYKIQRGQSASSAGLADSYSFPYSFPNACLSMNIITAALNGISGFTNSTPTFVPFPGLYNVTQYGFSTYYSNWQYQTMVSGTGINFYWVAIGY